MDSHTFLWHDYETFGADTRRDRPAQFAAIRTDAQLNEIGESLMWYCQPTNDYLPDPELFAMFYYYNSERLTPAQLLQ